MINDVYIGETGSGGDIAVNGNDLATVKGYSNAMYLAMFGTSGRNDQPGDNKGWWGNYLTGNPFGSETEAILTNTPLTSAGRLAIENAVKADLAFFTKDLGIPVKVSTVIVNPERLDIVIDLGGEVVVYTWSVPTGLAPMIPTTLVIPGTTSGNEWDNIVITATTSGPVPGMVWQYSEDGGDSWTDIDGSTNPGGLAGATFSGYNTATLSVTALYRGMNSWLVRLRSGVNVSNSGLISVTDYDVRVEGWRDAIYNGGGSVSSGEIAAIVTFVSQVNSIWSKLFYFFPLLGKSSVSQGVDLVTPTRAITWHGTFDYTNNWLSTSDTAAFADTKYNPDGSTYVSNFCVGVYSKLVGSSYETYCESSNLGELGLILIENASAGQVNFKLASQHNYNIVSVNTPTGLMMGVRVNSTEVKVIVNGAVNDYVGSYLSETAIGGGNIILANPAPMAPVELCCAFMGEALSDSEITQISNAIDALMTATSRHI